MPSERVVIVGDDPRPSEGELLASQRRVRFEPAAWGPDAADVLLASFRSVLGNGGAHLATFTVEDLDRAGQWFLGRNRFEEYDFARCLLTSAGLAGALPELVAGLELSDVEFRFSSPVSLDGSLAEALVWGGAYESFPGSAAEAKQLATAFSADLIGDRYEDFRVDQTSVGWSQWFESVAWDHTWIITDRREMRVTLLCVTDTD